MPTRTLGARVRRSRGTRGSRAQARMPRAMSQPGQIGPPLGPAGAGPVVRNGWAPPKPSSTQPPPVPGTNVMPRAIEDGNDGPPLAPAGNGLHADRERVDAAQAVEHVAPEAVPRDGHAPGDVPADPAAAPNGRRRLAADRRPRTGAGRRRRRARTRRGRSAGARRHGRCPSPTSRETRLRPVAQDCRRSRTGAGRRSRRGRSRRCRSAGARRRGRCPSPTSTGHP